MNIIFMGTPNFAVKTLECLINSKHKVLSVYTQPDKPKGRGLEMSISAVKETALQHNIKIFQPEKIKYEENVEQLKNQNPDLIVVVAFGQILNQSILDIPKYGCINVHGSLLPKLRGSAPIQWSIINGDEYAGVTTMKMDKGIDTGDILLQDRIKIEENFNSEILYNKLAVMGADLLIETINQLEEGTIKPIKQDDNLSTYAPMLSKTMADIDFSKSANEVFNFIRGLNPWPVAFTKINGKKLKVYSSEIIESKGKPYEILDKNELIIGCKDKAVKLLSVQIEGKKRMDSLDFLRGFKINEIEFLERG